MKHQDMVNARKSLLKRLRLELTGPNEPCEVLKERPSQRYLCGILWPAGTGMENSEDDQLGAGNEGEETGQQEILPPLSAAMNPSSLGLSFISRGSAPLQVTVCFGVYHQDLETKQWERTPVEHNAILLDPTRTGKRQSISLVSDNSLQIEYHSRQLQGDAYAISLFLVNRKQQQDKVARDSDCIFQPVIKVSDKDQARRFVVKKIEKDQSIYQSPDDESDNLLYKDQVVFASGHGTAVEWADLSSDGQAAGTLRTATIPSYELPRVIPPEWDKGGSLDMKELGQAGTGEEIYDLLSPLCNEYGKWIDEEREKIKTLDADLKKTAERHISNCEYALERIKKGLNTIRRDQTVFQAFSFANQAMSLQIEQTIWAKKKEKDFSSGPDSIKAQWRPFQIAFILQGIAGINDVTDDERNIADLLWFPTGGGKTEAYLGLAAFTMSLKKLKREQDGLRGDAGVTVLMRYTLRLLTIQQFQRATALICACEVLRSRQPDLYGRTPFRIGLWVGTKSTPNTFDEAAEAIKETKESYKRKDSSSLQTGTPVQVLTCPWCGSSLIKDEKCFTHSYFADKRQRRVKIFCTRKECEFGRKPQGQGIPVVVTDEEIYRLLPDLLIGTVDKFARMPWVGEVQGLFGKVQGEIKDWGFLAHGADARTMDYMNRVTGGRAEYVDKKELLPPELIIQDELHLISGPLGTMVGLYESAIDTLCSREINGKSIGPKIVASTATIRQAKQQIQGLFARDVAIFPGSGLSAGDSFFAVEQPVEQDPGRVYAGIYAPGKSMKTALVRIYAALLASTEAMDEYTDEQLDPYKTLVGYFNSLRELGGTVRLVEDDIRARMTVLEKRKQGQKYPFKQRVYGNDVPELTSRIDSRDIPKILDALNQPFYGNKETAPVDVVLASNMISVGVDVDRLGLMVVTGQPKTTAEYIQSTSRVGRKYPGLVITLYNWVRPRDTSHYEQFRSYHSALYRYVEAISVTPLASRARDRALAASIISMIRLSVENMAERQEAGNFELDHLEIERITDQLMDRVDAILDNDSQKEAVREEIRQEIEKHLTTWEDETKIGSLVYSGDKRKRNLLYSLGNKSSGAFGVPNSMRDVEPGLGIYLRQED